jgi:23S rRNA pseudouridine1911/1915/1917 synthase
MTADPRPTRAELTVSPEAAGSTLAAIVRLLLPGTSWSAAKEHCAAGRVRVNAAVARDPAARVAAGQHIAFDPTGTIAAPRLVVHVDAAVVVVEKPAGILTTPVERGDRDTLLHAAAAAIRRLTAHDRHRGGPTLRAVQRLDRETSGLLVFARTVPAERALQAQLKARTVWRRYLALVHGRGADATYATHLLDDRGDGLRGSWERSRAYVPGAEAPAGARLAVTHVHVERRFSDATLVSCRLETGRQHQIRIHLSEAGTPLLGETVYVRGAGQSAATARAPRPLLHAAELGFTHPTTGEKLRFSSAVPEDFEAVLRRLPTVRSARP